MNKCTRCGKENPPEVHTCTPLALHNLRLPIERIEEIQDDLMSYYSSGAQAPINLLFAASDCIGALLFDLVDKADELRRLYTLNSELVEALNWALDCLRFDPAERPMAHKFWLEAKAALKKAKEQA